MDDIYIDMRTQNRWISKYFNADFVSIDQLISCIEDLDSEVEALKEQIEDYENPNNYDSKDDFMEIWKKHRETGDL